MDALVSRVVALEAVVGVVPDDNLTSLDLNLQEEINMVEKEVRTELTTLEEDVQSMVMMEKLRMEEMMKMKIQVEPHMIMFLV